MRAIGVWVAMAFTALLMSCGNKTAKVTSRQAVSVREEYEHTGSGVTLSVTHQYGAALSGLVPLPFPQLHSPLTVPIRSQGIDLTLHIDSSGIRYEAKAHPVSRTQTVAINEQEEKTNINTQSSSKVAESVQNQRGIRWYWIVLAVLLVLLLIGWKVFKTNFKLF